MLSSSEERRQFAQLIKPIEFASAIRSGGSECEREFASRDWEKGWSEREREGEGWDVNGKTPLVKLSGPWLESQILNAALNGGSSHRTNSGPMGIGTPLPASSRILPIVTNGLFGFGSARLIIRIYF